MPALAYVGKIHEIHPIENADRIVSATVLCGEGGKWMGVVQKRAFNVGDPARVFLHDALLPQTPEFAFLQQRHYRIKLQKLRGVPSEVLIMPYAAGVEVPEIGTDITEAENVTKYEIPLPAQLRGLVKGNFPHQIPKTDEPNFQGSRGLLELLRDVPTYVTVKADGSSCTIYHFLNGEKGVCSRNMDLIETPDNSFWKTARKYGLPDILKPGTALQAELVGPGVQGNKMGLTELQLRVFNVWNENHKDYVDFPDALNYVNELGVPFVDIVVRDGYLGSCSDETLRELAEKQVYPNGKPAEGIVIRPVQEQRNYRGERLSIKVLNGLYV